MVRAYRINEYLDEGMAGGQCLITSSQTITTSSVSGSDTGSCRFLWDRDASLTPTLTLTIAHITTATKYQSAGWIVGGKEGLSLVPWCHCAGRWLPSRINKYLNELQRWLIIAATPQTITTPSGCQGKVGGLLNGDRAGFLASYKHLSQVAVSSGSY